MSRIHLVRDVLDKRVISRDDEPLGRVDGIVLELREGKAPRIAAVELGAITMAARLSERLGQWVARIKKRIGVSEDGPVRIPFEEISSFDLDLKVGVKADETHALEWEEWLSDRILRHIPGSGI